jgi:hypothetical protein
MRDSTKREPAVNEPRSRRKLLRRIFSGGVVSTGTAGVAELVGVPAARAATPQLPRLPATMILKALPADASPSIAAAIEAGCCITYTLDEHACGSEHCPSGYCCYQITSPACGIDEVQCVEVSCAEGDFTTGC